MTKTATKILSLALCLLLALSAGSVVGLSFNATASADGGVSEGGTTPVANVPTFKVIDGTDKSTNNGYLNIADGSTETKICISIENTPYYTFQASDVGTVVTGYTLYTGNDTKPDETHPDGHTGRNPKAWKLEGSIDGANWTVITSVTNDDKLPTVGNKEGCAYTFTNTTPYWYYKITFTARQGAEGDDYNLMQISEIEFTATAPVAEVDSAQEFAAAVEKGGNIKLVGDVALTEDIEIYKKAVSIDLNGYVLSGRKITAYGAAELSSVLMLSDSRPTAPHTNTSLPIGGVVESKLDLQRKVTDTNYQKGNAYLYANGGTVTNLLTLGTSNAVVDYTGESMTVFKGGVYGNAAIINAGLYYGEVKSSNETERPFRTTNKKVIFQNGDETITTQFLRSGDKATVPTAPTNEGYEFVKWYNSENNNDFNSASTVTADCTIKAMWLKEVATFADLKGEIDKGNSVRLTADITLTGDLAVNGGKNIILDLNGHVISGDKKLYGTGNGGTENPGVSTRFTIIDSNPTATHQDASLPIGGCLNVDISVTASSSHSGKIGEFHLHANGGTIKKVHCTSYACYIYWSGGNKPSAIGEITGTSDGKTKPTVYGGLFYYEQGVDASATKVTYTSDDKVYAVLAMNSSTPTKKAVEPIAPTKKGYAFVGWYNGDTKHDFTKTLSESITLTAKWRDNAAPVITGVDADSRYCGSKEVTITDDSSFTVTVGGTEVALTDGKFTIDMSGGSDKTIVATDAENNSVTLVVKYGHTFGEWIDEVPKTCTTDGTAGHKDCSVCGKHFDTNGTEITDLTIQASHTWSTDKIIAGTPANCTNAGEVAHWHCSACEKNYQSNKTTELTNIVIPAKGHTFGSWGDEVPATCTDKGTAAHKDCSVCGRHFDSNETEIADLAISAKGHTFGDWIDEVPATSKVEGVKGHKDCSVCNKHFDSDGNEIADLVIKMLPEKGLSGGAIVAIAVGGTVVAGAGGLSVVWFVIKKRSFAELLAAAKGIFKK